MELPSVQAWLVAVYGLVLLGVAWGFDRMAARVSHKAATWRTSGFVYHPDHDAWRCPQDQWLWPTSFDPTNRVMRYRGKPAVCNSCPVKSSCTASDLGREITREVDPWPYSEAGRFHRGIACVIVVLALVMPLAALIAQHSASDVLVLATTVVVVLAAGAPLARHLVRTPAGAPQHLPHLSRDEAIAASQIDRYRTRWGVGKGGGNPT